MIKISAKNAKKIINWIMEYVFQDVLRNNSMMINYKNVKIAQKIVNLVLMEAHVKYVNKITYLQQILKFVYKVVMRATIKINMKIYANYVQIIVLTARMIKINVKNVAIITYCTKISVFQNVHKAISMPNLLINV